MSPGATSTVRAARMWARSPIAPSASSLCASMVWGWWRHIRPSMQTRPAASAASKHAAASAAVTANGFSQSTCLPARSALIVHSVWSAIGSGTYTASTASEASSCS
jgi:hypothetical protein